MQRGVTDEKLKELVSPENFKKYAAVARPSIEASIKGDFALKELGRQQNLVVSEDEVELTLTLTLTLTPILTLTLTLTSAACSRSTEPPPRAHPGGAMRRRLAAREPSPASHTKHARSP